MAKKGLVSIIIPVYNTDPFLMKKCLRSVLGQTYKNIEILIVNDGSTEIKTLSFINSIRSDSVRILNKENGGVSSARNLGLKEANGEYIFFLDSDDYIGLDTIDNMVKKINDSDYVAIIAKMITVVDKKIYNPTKIDDGKIQLSEKFNLILATTVLFASQGLLIKSKIAKKHKFNPELKYGEDLLYGIEILSEGDSYYLNNSTYYYVLNNLSTTLKYSSSNAERYLKDFNHIYRYLCNKYPKEKEMIYFMMCDKINLILFRYYSATKPSFYEYREVARFYKKFLLTTRIPKANIEARKKLLVKAFYNNQFIIHYYLTSAKYYAQKVKRRIQKGIK